MTWPGSHVCSMYKVFTYIILPQGTLPMYKLIDLILLENVACLVYPTTSHCTHHAHDLKLSWCGVIQVCTAPACHMILSICYERNSRSSSVIEGFLVRPALEFISPLSLRILLVTACNGTVTSWLCPCTGMSRSVSLVSAAAIIVTGENRTRDTDE